MRMTDFVVRDAIIPELTATGKEGVIREMIGSLGAAGYFKTAETEDKRNGREFDFRCGEDPKAHRGHGKPQIEHRAARMVFQISGHVLQEKFT